MLGLIAQTAGRVFGTDKAATALIDNVSNGLDKLVYTGEEKAEDKAAAITEARQMVIKWLAATSGQNLARRILAFMITTTWLLQYVITVIMSTLSIWVDNPDAFIQTANVVGGYAETMKGAVMLILSFYFASPYMGSIVEAAMNKFGNKK